MANHNNSVIPSLLPFRWGDIKAISEETGIPYNVVRSWRMKSEHDPTEENNRILEAAIRLLENRKKAYERAAVIAQQYSGNLT